MDGPKEAPPSKTSLRVEGLRRRTMLGAEEHAAKSAAIVDRMAAFLAARHGAVVAAYMPIRNEVDVEPLFPMVAAYGVTFALPAVVQPESRAPAEIRFLSYAPGDTLAVGPFGARAPLPLAPEVDPQIVFLPLTAFDRAGGRLGYGRAFYDRALARLAGRGLWPVRIGVGFAVQEVAAIPLEPHDVRLDWVVTERETLETRRG